MSKGTIRPASLLYLAAVILLLLSACSQPEGEGEETRTVPTATAVGVTQTQATPTATALAVTQTPPTPTATAVGVAETPPAIEQQAPIEFMLLLEDVAFVDLETGHAVFEVDVKQEFSNNPKVELVPLVSGITLEDLVRSNMQWLAQRGYSAIEIPVASGDGTLLYDSKVLLPKVHPGFDYDSQYLGNPEEEELIMPEEEAKQKYRALQGVFPLLVAEAHNQGIKVFANIESLAHIINWVEGSGIGGSADTLRMAGNLPAPSVGEVLGVIDEVITLGADAISAEAYADEYDQAIAQHLKVQGVPYKHSGADLGTVWAGYYYSLYPDRPEVAPVYLYIYTSDSVIGTTNGTIFARARALTEQPPLALVVGSYNPLPCDTTLSIADLYSTSRGEGELPIDQEAPSLADGTPVENCAAAVWPSLALIAIRRQGVELLEFTEDLLPSLEAISSRRLVASVRERLEAHPAVEDDLPIANVIVDMPQYGPEDWLTADDFFSMVMEPLLGSIDDALGAAGYQTVLTYDRPWDGGQVALTYIVTAGGNEGTGEPGNAGPPYWLSALPLEPELEKLLDPAVHAGPVFIHPIFGVPDLGNWKDIRQRFGLPERFAFNNASLSTYENYHTSLLSSWPVNAEGDTVKGAPQQYLTPDTGEVLGKRMHLIPYSDTTSLGQAANLVRETEVASNQVVAAGPMNVPTMGSTTEQAVAPYLVTDGQGRFLWLINQLHHEALTYLVGDAISRVTGRPPVLEEPALAHVWSGKQTFALAYDRTEVVLNLPFSEGEAINITVYDVRGDQVRRETSRPYHGPLRVSLDKYSLLVVEAS